MIDGCLCHTGKPRGSRGEPAAALHLPLAHPAVAAILVGTSRPEHVSSAAAWLDREIPAQLWGALRRRGLLADGNSNITIGDAPGDTAPDTADQAPLVPDAAPEDATADGADALASAPEPGTDDAAPQDQDPAPEDAATDESDTAGGGAGSWLTSLLTVLRQLFARFG